jgi:hypothetical protein
MNSLLLRLSLTAFLTGKLAAQATLNPMVPLFHKWQMEKVEQLVERAASLGESRVQFCIALQSELNEKNEPRNLGILRETRHGGSGNTFYNMDAELQEQFSGYLKRAFAAAKKNGLQVAVLMHINAYGAKQEWRQNIAFDPLMPIAGNTYQKAFVQPVIQALEAEMDANGSIEVSLTGEMGVTVFRHPESWVKLVQETKKQTKLTNLKLGVSFNHEVVNGGVLPGEKEQKALSKLWKECDFVGTSLYQGVRVPPTKDDFLFNMGKFIGEFSSLGCPLPAGKPVHIVEIGLGGSGRSTKDWQVKVPAECAADAAAGPYLGTADEKLNPWKLPELTKLRGAYHKALCDYLAAANPRYPVPTAYLWSFGSWDVHGIEQPEFADQEIMRSIQEHNARVRNQGSTRPSGDN